MPSEVLGDQSYVAESLRSFTSYRQSEKMLLVVSAWRPPGKEAQYVIPGWFYPLSYNISVWFISVIKYILKET